MWSRRFNANRFFPLKPVKVTQVSAEAPQRDSEAAPGRFQAADPRVMIGAAALIAAIAGKRPSARGAERRSRRASREAGCLMETAKR